MKYRVKIVYFIISLVFLFTHCEKPEMIPSINTEKKSSGVEEDLRTIFFIGSGIAYIGGDNGLVLKSMNGGDTWNKIKEPDTATYQTHYVYGIYFETENSGMILVKKSGKLYFFTTQDGGNTWNSDTLLYNQLLPEYLKKFPHEGAFNLNDNLGFSLSEATGKKLDGDLYKITNQHDSIRIATGYKYVLHGIHFSDAGNGYIVGENSLLNTTDGGSHWEWLRSQYGTNIGADDLEAVSYIFYDVWCFSNYGFAVGNKGIIIKFSK